MKVKLNGNDFFRVTSEYGAMEEGLRTTPHSGIDLAMPEGTPLYSPVDGIVSKVVDYGKENLGKGVFIETEDGKTVIMGHLSEFKVSEGMSVNQGDLVALSGNTGNSTGAHLHLGLKNNNEVVNPEPLLNDNNFYDNFFQKDGIITKITNKDSSEVSFMDGAKSFGEFLQKWHDTGSFWEAMYGKPFFEVMSDFFKQLGYDIMMFVLENGDFFFLAPAIIFMFATFFIGKNKFTKYIIPLWFTFFVSKVFYHLVQ